MIKGHHLKIIIKGFSGTDLSLWAFECEMFYGSSSHHCAASVDDVDSAMWNSQWQGHSQTQSLMSMSTEAGHFIVTPPQEVIQTRVHRQNWKLVNNWEKLHFKHCLKLIYRGGKPMVSLGKWFTHGGFSTSMSVCPRPYRVINNQRLVFFQCWTAEWQASYTLRAAQGPTWWFQRKSTGKYGALPLVIWLLNFRYHVDHVNITRWFPAIGICFVLSPVAR